MVSVKICCLSSSASACSWFCFCSRLSYFFCMFMILCSAILILVAGAVTQSVTASAVAVAIVIAAIFLFMFLFWLLCKVAFCLALLSYPFFLIYPAFLCFLSCFDFFYFFRFFIFCFFKVRGWCSLWMYILSWLVYWMDIFMDIYLFLRFWLTFVVFIIFRDVFVLFGELYPPPVFVFFILFYWGVWTGVSTHYFILSFFILMCFGVEHGFLIFDLIFVFFYLLYIPMTTGTSLGVIKYQLITFRLVYASSFFIILVYNKHRKMQWNYEDYMDSLSDDECFYVWMWIIHLFWAEAWIICGLTESLWFEEFMESKYVKQLKKSKLRNALESLLCCWILEIDDWKIKFNKDRYLEMNEMGISLNKENHKNYTWLWTYEQIREYESMIKYVKKLCD